MASKKNKSNGMSDERRTEVRALVVSYVREAKNYTRAAKRLTEEKVPTLSGAKVWPPITVRDLVVKDDPKLAKSLARKPAKGKAEKPTKPEVVADKKPKRSRSRKPAEESPAVTPGSVVVRQPETQEEVVEAIEAILA